VTASLKSAELIAYDRSAEWKLRTASGLRSALDLPALKLRLPLKEVYRHTPIGT
jgi:hypothetical protein